MSFLEELNYCGFDFDMCARVFETFRIETHEIGFIGFYFKISFYVELNFRI